jgi:PAS domain S-box-containing protein
MIPAKPTPDESRRLEALREYNVLDTLPERALDDLTKLAAHLCGVPMATISLIDEDRQWFKSRLGMPATETPREISFCGHAIQQRELFIVPDATRDERFAGNPVVTTDPHICFYAGAPLVNEEDAALGMLCVMDHKPHTLNQEQKDVLQILAQQVMTHLELRRHSHKLMESEERLRLVTNNARLGLVVVDQDRRYTFANTAYTEILDLPLSDIVGKRVPDVLSAVYDTQVRPRLDRAFAGERVTYELHKPYPLGKDRYYEVRYEPTQSENTVNLVVVVISDITERKLAEISANRLAAIVEYSEDAIISKDLNGIVTSWNRGAETIFGYTEEEMIGTSILRLIPEERQNEETQILASIARGKSVHHFETQRRTKAGPLIDVSITASPLKDASGKPIGASKVARDITARRKAERQIAEQAAFLDKARDAILVRDLEGKILFWNKGAEHLYGWTSSEVLGRNSSDLLYATPAIFQEFNQRTIDHGEWQGDLCHLTKDRRELIVEARWTLIRDEGGQPKSILAINTDITEKKKIEAQFMRAQRMESIGTLAGGVAHDLNNILAPILMSIDLLKTFSERPEAQTILETIEVSAKRGADIVRQVLSFARGIEGERIEVQPKHLLKDLESIIKDTFPKDIRLSFCIPKDSWTILGDPTQVHQVLLNLCVNARDAMPNGGNLTLSVENCVLDTQYASMNIQAQPGRYLVISVVDSGTGIPPEVIDKIFEPFFTTKAPNKGTGLGLSTVMAIVKSHGGFVNVYSEPGKGTTFKVYLPARDTPYDGSAKVEINELPRGNGETILLVDDEASILTITSQTLQAFGYKVLTSMDGADAVATYAQHRYEIALVLTDMMMPIMDGPILIHALKRINPEVKIIAASGLNTHENGVKASGGGVQHFLTKPYTAGILLKAVRGILDGPS